MNHIWHVPLLIARASHRFNVNGQCLPCHPFKYVNDKQIGIYQNWLSNFDNPVVDRKSPEATTKSGIILGIEFSKWDDALLCNTFSHWPSSCSEWSLGRKIDTLKNIFIGSSVWRNHHSAGGGGITLKITEMWVRMSNYAHYFLWDAITHPHHDSSNYIPLFYVDVITHACPNIDDGLSNGSGHGTAAVLLPGFAINW